MDLSDIWCMWQEWVQLLFVSPIHVVRAGLRLDPIEQKWRGTSSGQICLELSQCCSRNNTITSPQNPVILLKGNVCVRACICLCVCTELGLCWACDQTTGWCPLQRRGVSLDGSNTAHGPSFKRPPIIAPTYSQRRMSLNVDHTIHQLWWSSGAIQHPHHSSTSSELSSVLTEAPSRGPQSPSVAGGVAWDRWLPQSCHTNRTPAFPSSFMSRYLAAALCLPAACFKLHSGSLLPLPKRSSSIHTPPFIPYTCLETSLSRLIHTPVRHAQVHDLTLLLTVYPSIGKWTESDWNSFNVIWFWHVAMGY